MDMKKLYNDFADKVAQMSDAEIRESISEAAKHSSMDDFVKFAKDEFDLTVTPIKSDDPDSFTKIFNL